jgi:exodeoxyribonuclease V alpha subunit
LVRAFSGAVEKKSAIKSDIELSEGQHEAVEAALSRGVLVITGGPGTGKTTTINTVIAMLEQQKLHITLAAPTGRAAKRMTETTGREACTIHRLLEVEFMSENTRRQRFKKNEDDPLETDVLIVDEFSMVDIMLLRSLLAAIAEGTRLIIVGDVDQLPSVGAGNVLADLISSGVLPVVRLTEVFRQAAQSAIITNAHRINRGLYPELNDKERDFFHVRRMQPEAVASTLLDLITERLPAWKGYKPEDIQVLSPMRRGVLGVTNLNTVLQARLNPPARDKNEREHGSVVFRVGDRVMQVKNNYDAAWEMLDARGRRIDFGEGVFNGDMGVVAEVDEDDGLTVEFDGGHRISYDFSRLDELELAYAVTVHKSQGSEYPVVILPLAGGPPMLLSRNLLYTAVTRARDLCIIVGREDVLHRMVDNSRETERYTALARRLQMLDGALGQTTLTD